MEVKYPYLVTISASDRINIDKFKSAGVAGVVVKAGSYFNQLHKVTDNIPAGLDKNLKFLEDNSYPFGLMFDIRSRNVSEVSQEMSMITSVVSNRSVTLGIWFNFYPLPSRKKNVNLNILSELYDQMSKIGYAKQCGLYSSKMNLSKLDWSKLCYNWYLWIDNPVENIQELYQTITPDFFK